MLPSSHAVPINSIAAVALLDSRALADAFSKFISASAALEGSYRSLQQEVARLGTELAERNAVLSAALAENERMRATLRQMMDSLPCGVFVLNGLQDVVMINPAGRTLLKVGNARVKTLRDLCDRCNIDLQSYAAVEESCGEIEACVRTAHGNQWLAITKQKLASPTASAHNLPELRSIWILRDITVARQAERERDDARNALALAEVSTILAHEIRNPLASMELFAGLIIDQPEQSAEWTANLLAGIRLLAGTVNNVLSINSGTSPSIATVDLTACIHSAVEFVRPIADQAGVAVRLEQIPALITIQGNEDAIQQIVLNLVRNSIRHTPAEGSISISTIQKANSALVQIMDTGSGIPSELLGHIFDAGFSGDGSTPGLGLAVCKRLMNQFGGKIAVASRMGEGTTFELEFPSL